MNEYRVRWQRQGHRQKVRRYAHLARAQSFLALLTGDPHASCDHREYCIWDQGLNRPVDPPPWVQEPVLEARAVGSWGPA